MMAERICSHEFRNSWKLLSHIRRDAISSRKSTRVASLALSKSMRFDGLAGLSRTDRASRGRRIGYVFRSSGTLPPFSASLAMTCLCSQMFIAAESSVSPV